jgi:hypothetical protein
MVECGVIMYFIQRNHPCVAECLYDADMNIFTQDPDTEKYQAYLAWVAEGNEATEWNPEETA